jgi:phosphate starvation-inducible protein PhoH and related proteins
VSIVAVEVTLEPVDNERLANLCGQFDEHLRLLERRTGVEISNRGNQFNLTGTDDDIVVTERVIRQLYSLTETKTVSAADVHLELRNTQNDEEPAAERDETIRTRRTLIRPRGGNQRRYLEAIRINDISFGIGPAGTGKTYLAVACAVAALDADTVRRVCLVRPAVEAGERLGFLPGDMAQKVDPYLRPLYDALYEMLGFERVAKLIERNVIEVTPLAFMRGRTLNESFIILDEAQNTTIEQMKMFLTRIGFGSKAVVTGDVTQIDLPRGRASGLKQVSDVLKDVEGISFTFFHSRDVVRHTVVARILDAYAAHEKPDQPDGGNGGGER